MLLKDRNRYGAGDRSFELIVFDFDGVIIDSAVDLVAAARYSLQRVGSSDCAFDQVRGYIGGGARNLLWQCLDADKKDRADEALRIFRAYYETTCTTRTVLYPGVREALDFYTGKIYLALATFKIRPATEKILAALCIQNCFDVVVTSDDVQRPKPDPECIHYILQRLHFDPEAALLVGDTPTDVKTGKNAGITTCAVSYGIGDRKALADSAPDFLIDDIRELHDIVAIPAPQHVRP